jgi:hypothetical protein
LGLGPVAACSAWSHSWCELQSTRASRCAWVRLSAWLMLLVEAESA